MLSVLTRFIRILLVQDGDTISSKEISMPGQKYLYDLKNQKINNNAEHWLIGKSIRFYYPHLIEILFNENS